MPLPVSVTATPRWVSSARTTPTSIRPSARLYLTVVFDGVGQQVDQYLLESAPVAANVSVGRGLGGVEGGVEDDPHSGQRY